MSLAILVFYFTMSIPLLFILAMGTIWIPQIIKNIQNRAKEAPSFLFIVVTSIENIYTPVFIYLVDDNIVDNEPKPWIAILLIIVMASQVHSSTSLGHRIGITEVEGTTLRCAKEMASTSL